MEATVLLLATTAALWLIMWLLFLLLWGFSLTDLCLLCGCSVASIQVGCFWDIHKDNHLNEHQNMLKLIEMEGVTDKLADRGTDIATHRAGIAAKNYIKIKMNQDTLILFTKVNINTKFLSKTLRVNLKHNTCLATKWFPRLITEKLSPTTREKSWSYKY